MAEAVLMICNVLSLYNCNGELLRAAACSRRALIVVVAITAASVVDVAKASRGRKEIERLACQDILLTGALEEEEQAEEQQGQRQIHQHPEHLSAMVRCAMFIILRRWLARLPSNAVVEFSF